MSIAAFRLLESRGLKPSFVAGHSLGEYSANVAAGTFAFADAVSIVRRRGRYMQEAVPVGTGAMAAILGLDAETVADVCREALNDVAAGEVVSPANINGGGQVAIAGSARRRRSRERARESARREADRAPAGERAVSLRADEAGRRSTRARTAGAEDAGSPRARRRQRGRAAQT